MNPLYLAHVTTAGTTTVVPEDAPVLVTYYDLDVDLGPDSPIRGSAVNQPAANVNVQAYGSPLTTVNDTFDHNYHTRDYYEKVTRQNFNGEFTRNLDSEDYVE